MQLEVTKVIDEVCSLFCSVSETDSGQSVQESGRLSGHWHVVSGTEWTRGPAVTATPAPQCSVLACLRPATRCDTGPPEEHCACSTLTLLGNWVYPVEFFRIKPLSLGVTVCCCMFPSAILGMQSAGTKGGREVSQPWPQPMFLCVQRISFSQIPTSQTHTNPLSEAPHPDLNDGKINTGSEWEPTAPEPELSARIPIGLNSGRGGEGKSCFLCSLWVI